jgi:hypothetical protein
MSILFAPIIAQNGILSLNVGTGAPVNPVSSQGLLLDETGAVYATTTTPPALYAFALPFDLNGRLVVEDEPIAYYAQGLPFTANGALSVGTSTGVDEFYNQGMGFNSDGSVIASGITPPPPTPPTDWGPMLQGLNNAAFTGSAIEDFAAGDDSVWIAVGANSGAASRTTDDGATWTALPNGLNSGSTTAAWRGLAGDGEGTFVAVAQSGWAARSTNNGATWTALPRGLNTGVNPSWTSVRTDSNGVWVAVSGTGHSSRSADNGATWTALPQGLNSGSTTAAFLALATDGLGNWVAMANSNNNSARSADNGATWTALVVDTSPVETMQGAVGNLNGNFVAFGGTGYAWRTTNPASPWTEIAPRGLNSGNVTTAFTASAMDDADNVVAAGSSAWAAYSADAGVTWSVLPRGLNSGTTTNTVFCCATNKAGVWMAGFNSAFAARSPPI